MTSYAIHPLAELIPAMTETEYTDLRESIRTGGQIEPITIYDHMVLDGRHRLRACTELGIQPKIEEYDGDTPARFVIAKNVTRRQLTTSQKALIAASFLPELRKEDNRGEFIRTAERDKAGRPITRANARVMGSPERTPRKTELAAELVGLRGDDSVKRAVRVAKHAPELIEPIRAGEMTVSAAEKIIKEREPTPFMTKKQAEKQAASQNENAERFDRMISNLNSTASALKYIDVDAVVEDDRTAQWDKGLTTVIRALVQARTTLRNFNGEPA